MCVSNHILMFRYLYRPVLRLCKFETWFTIHFSKQQSLVLPTWGIQSQWERYPPIMEPCPRGEPPFLLLTLKTTCLFIWLEAEQDQDSGRYSCLPMITTTVIHVKWRQFNPINNWYLFSVVFMLLIMLWAWHLLESCTLKKFLEKKLLKKESLY